VNAPVVLCRTDAGSTTDHAGPVAQPCGRRTLCAARAAVVASPVLLPCTDGHRPAEAALPRPVDPTPPSRRLFRCQADEPSPRLHKELVATPFKACRHPPPCRVARRVAGKIFPPRTAFLRL
jgi:hypothetical protein